MKRIVVIALALGVAACGETKECKKLKRIRTKYERIVDTAERRAKQGETAKKRAEEMKAKADDLAKELGIAGAEKDAHETLEKRSAEIGGKVVRGTRPLDPVVTGGQSGEETLWTFSFDAKSLPDARDKMNKLIATPPLVRFVGFYPPDKGSTTYRVEAVRAVVDQAPMKIPPTKLDEPPDASKVASEFGFCGAGDMRKEIRDLHQRYEKAKPLAESLTVNLPLAASYDGLWRRTKVVRDIEDETRKTISAVLEAVIKAKLNLKAAGVERDIAIVELRGDERARGKMDKHLPKDVLSRMKAEPLAEKGFVRATIVNRAAERRHNAEEKMREAIEKARQRKQGQGGHDGHEH